MTKKILSLFAILMILGAPTMVMAENTDKVEIAEWNEDTTVDFGTDSYDEDGCFC